ncbi:MAG: hypothetical protein A3C47_02315 [Omnitrophica bacterium RIFCSPHIGHO2_02_FULL_51_18]|nr:MAG: hypothetical protein A3C47_02315 [Omnitrophica bacterium RIFCSPHIGHO2_02_FULL_51_18]
MILEIKNLTVEFLKSGGRREVFAAVNSLDLGVSEGSFTALVGESGSGKSVTALSICRLLKPYRMSGVIRFAAEQGKITDLFSCSERELSGIRGRKIGCVFQDPASSLNPLMKIGGQLDETYRAHFCSSPKETRERSLAGLEAAKIKDPERVYRSYPHELSGGMKQRAMIAMALTPGPRFLIADEPTTALDGVTESEILQLLVNLKNEKSLTVLFITHNLPLAAAHADRIHVMQKGRLVETMKKEAEGFLPREVYSKRLFKAGFYGVNPKSFIEV